MRLKTRDSDGAALCAQEDHDAPSRYAAPSARMSSAPAAVTWCGMTSARMPAGVPAVIRCSMTCTADYLCQHFNYVSTDFEYPCHLYYYYPTHFDVEPNCKHYETPGETPPNSYRICK